MKKLFLIFSLAFLNGCTLLDAYLMTKYDPNEYQLITSVRLSAQISQEQCIDAETSKNNAVKILSETQMFMLYSEHIPRNKDMVEASKNLHDMAKGLNDLYIKSNKVSPTFCKIKFQNIETSADKIQTVISGRPR